MTPLNRPVYGFVRSDAPLPVILGGDFNSMPDSAVYAHMTSTHEDGLPMLTSLFGTGLWKEGSDECSTNRTSSPASEPPFTTVTPDFTETIDYLFGAGVTVSRLHPLPERDSMGEGLPMGPHPSDHLPLVADVSLV